LIQNERIQAKNTLWEGGTRLAACIWSPMVESKVMTDLMRAEDWLPTLYEAVGKFFRK